VWVHGGVAHEDVDAPLPAARLGGQAGELVLAADVAGDGGGPPAARRDGRHHLLAGFQFAAGDDHRRPTLGQALGDGAADAARRAGDQRRLPGEVEEIHTDPIPTYWV
jgi:hypothetical protein